jgi:hypothetical protein
MSASRPATSQPPHVFTRAERSGRPMRFALADLESGTLHNDLTGRPDHLPSTAIPARQMAHAGDTPDILGFAAAQGVHLRGLAKCEPKLLPDLPQTSWLSKPCHVRGGPRSERHVSSPFPVRRDRASHTSSRSTPPVTAWRGVSQRSVRDESGR